MNAFYLNQTLDSNGDVFQSIIQEYLVKTIYFIKKLSGDPIIALHPLDVLNEAEYEFLYNTGSSIKYRWRIYYDNDLSYVMEVDEKYVLNEDGINHGGKFVEVLLTTQLNGVKVESFDSMELYEKYNDACLQMEKYSHSMCKSLYSRIVKYNQENLVPVIDTWEPITMN